MDALTLNQVISQLIKLRASSNDKKINQHLRVRFGEDVCSIVGIDKTKRGLELVLKGSHDTEPPPRAEEIAEETQRIQETWSREEEHRRRGLNQRELTSGIHICDDSGMSYDWGQQTSESI